MIDISGIAFAIRSDSAQSPTPLKLSQAQQCVAAALGYKTLAALQASGDDGLPLGRHTHIVLDADLLVRRRRELGLDVGEEELTEAVTAAFRRKLAGISVHASFEGFEEAAQLAVDHLVLNHPEVAGEMAMTNSKGIREIYLPYEIDWSGLPDDGGRAEFPFFGHVTMEIDEDRMYWGHRIDLHATVWVERPGEAVWEAGCTIARAKLYRDGDDEVEQGPPRVSLAEALAEELDVAVEEAEHLEDIEPLELSSDDGLVYGFLLDLTEAEEIPHELRSKLQEKHGSLQLHLPPHFYERVRVPMD